MDSYLIGVVISEVAFLSLLPQTFIELMPVRLLVYIVSLLIWTPIGWWGRRKRANRSTSEQSTIDRILTLGPLPEPQDAIAIQLPDNITVYYRPASLWRRARAFFADAFVLALWSAVLAFAVLMALPAVRHTNIEACLDILLPLALQIFALGYFVWHELMHDGQTPGKRKAGIRILHETGRGLTLEEILVRTTLLILSFLPPIALVELCCLLSGPARQTLADLAVGSVVVVDPTCT